MKCKSCGLFSVFELCTQCRPHEKAVKRFLKNKSSKKKKVKVYKPKMDDFYKSWGWKKLRYAVLKYYGYRCMCCGATPADGKSIVVDHIYPRKKFPKLEMDFNNLQVLCNDCNMGKSDDDYTDFREPLPEGAYDHIDSILRH